MKPSLWRRDRNKKTRKCREGNKAESTARSMRTTAPPKKKERTRHPKRPRDWGNSNASRRTAANPPESPPGHRDASLLEFETSVAVSGAESALEGFAVLPNVGGGPR